MAPIFHKKIIGTLVYIGILVVGFGAVAAGVQAKFLSTMRLVNVEGIVTDISGLALTVHTAGNADVAVGVEPGRTIFGGDADSFADIEVGDGVTVMGVRQGGVVVARVLKVVPGAGYGSQGPAAMFSHAVIAAKGPSSLTLDIGAALVTVQVTVSTKFNGGSFASLSAGGVVSVTGHDTGTQIIAKTVNILSSGGSL